MIELKPCPFCGASARIDGYLSGGYFAHCSNVGECPAPITNTRPTQEEAIADWNLRAQATAPSVPASAAQGAPDETERLHKIETAAKAVIELWGVTPRWNDLIKQANALYRLAYAIEPDKWTPKLANGLTEAETSATRSVSGLTQPQAESEGGEP